MLPVVAPAGCWRTQHAFRCLHTRPARSSLQACRARSKEFTARDCPSGLQADGSIGRRQALVLTTGVIGTAAGAGDAFAISGNPLGFKKELKKRRRKIPEGEYTEGPQGLKYYDIVVGSGATAQVGQRIAIHYEVKWRGITFMTSRQGMGVTGGNPLGFDVGQPPGAPGSTLPGIDLGVRGMKVGGLRALLVPANLAYGSRGYGEIPGDATLDVIVELLSIKTNALGYRTKLVEG